MPISLDEHLTGLHLASAEFEGYTLANGSAPVLTAATGEKPYRDAFRERRRIHGYLDSLDGAYRSNVGELAASIPPMSDLCRLSVFIPARFEQNYIVRTVDQLCRQVDSSFHGLPQYMYEVIIVNNRFSDEPADTTRDRVIECVRSRSIDNVHVVDVEFPVGTPCPLTLACRYAADLIICRAISRRHYSWPLYLAPEDADLVWTDRRQLHTQLLTLDTHPELDAVRGYTDRCPWMYSDHDLVTLTRRSWNLVENYLTFPHLSRRHNAHADFRRNRVTTNGWNTAFTAESYAMVRGYTPDRWLGNDVDIGEKLSIIRGQEGDSGVIVNTEVIRKVPTRAEGSPRRWFLQAANGIQPYDRTNDYENFFSRRTLQSISDGDGLSLVQEASDTARISTSNLWMFESELTDRWGALLTAASGHDEIAFYQAQAIFDLLGIAASDWEIVDERVRLRRFDGLQRSLELIRDCNAGNGPVREYPRYSAAPPIWRSYI